jgi:hypothetical protein
VSLLDAPDDTVSCDDVLIVQRSETGWHCEIHGRRVFVGQVQIAPGTFVPAEGTRGALTLTAAAAQDLGLRLSRIVS